MRRVGDAGPVCGGREGVGVGGCTEGEGEAGRVRCEGRGVGTGVRRRAGGRAPARPTATLPALRAGRGARVSPLGPPPSKPRNELPSLSTFSENNRRARQAHGDPSDVAGHPCPRPPHVDCPSLPSLFFESLSPPPFHTLAGLFRFLFFYSSSSPRRLFQESRFGAARKSRQERP